MVLSIREMPKMAFTFLYWMRVLPAYPSCCGRYLHTLISKISLINQILELSLKGLTIDGEMAYIIMEGAVLFGSGSLLVLREQLTCVLDPRLVFDGVVDGNPEWIKVELCGFVLIWLVCVCVLCWFMDNSRIMVWFLPWGLLFWLLALESLFRGGIGHTLSCLFDLHVLLHPNENVPHLGGITLYQMLVERVATCNAVMNTTTAKSLLQLYTRAICLWK